MKLQGTNIVIMNTADTEGGAARCAYRLHKGIRQTNTESVYVVQNKFSSDADILVSQPTFGKLSALLRPGIDRLPMRLYRNRLKNYFSTGLMFSPDLSLVNKLNPDIINLHYVAEGFLPIKSLEKFTAPIVWTMHDSWPFTGGCHLPGECTRYERSCGRCPILGSRNFHDLSNWIWKKKLRAWRDLNMTIVTGSNWLAGCVKKSSLFKNYRVEAINPGLDLTCYKPTETNIARSQLSLPPNKKLILFGAMHSTTDPNKGFEFLRSAIKGISKSKVGENSELVIFGASEPLDKPDFGMKAHYVGRLHDDLSLAILYSAADVMVVPSIRESFGQTGSEALACGTPVVAFGATGLLDIVDHKHNGYLAKPYDAEDLAHGILWVLLQNEIDCVALSENAREKAESAFSIERMTDRYIELFEEILMAGKRTNSKRNLKL